MGKYGEVRRPRTPARGADSHGFPAACHPGQRQAGLFGLNGRRHRRRACAPKVEPRPRKRRRALKQLVAPQSAGRAAAAVRIRAAAGVEGTSRSGRGRGRGPLAVGGAQAHVCREGPLRPAEWPPRGRCPPGRCRGWPELPQSVTGVFWIAVLKWASTVIRSAYDAVYISKLKRACALRGAYRGVDSRPFFGISFSAFPPLRVIFFFERPHICCFKCGGLCSIPELICRRKWLSCRIIIGLYVCVWGGGCTS